MALTISVLMLFSILFHSIMDSEELAFHHRCSVTVNVPFVPYEPKYPPPLSSTPCCAFIEKEVADYEVAKFLGLSKQELNEKNKTLYEYVTLLRKEMPEFKGIGLISTAENTNRKLMRINFHLKFPTFLDPCTRSRIPNMMWQTLRNVTFTEMNNVLSTKTSKNTTTRISSFVEMSTISIIEQISTKTSGFSKTTDFTDPIDVEIFDYPLYHFHDDDDDDDDSDNGDDGTKSCGLQNKAIIHVNIFISTAWAIFVYHRKWMVL